MCPFNRSLCVRMLMLGLLVLLAAGVVTAAPAQVMLVYSHIPVYGPDSAVNAEMDVYLPEIASYEVQRELGIILQNDLPAVLFVPALSDPVMHKYAQNLTDRGYGVIAVDYRPQYAVADSMCALAWAHQVGSTFHLDPNHIAAVGTGSGGQIAALMGSADLGWQPTYEGGLVRIDTPAPYPIHGLDRCPYAMPEAPMIEAVATYNAALGTPVVLVDQGYQMASLPPVGTTRAQMVAAFNEFAFAPPDEWQSMVTGPEPAVVTTVDAEDQNANLDLWQLAPPEIAAAHEVTTSADVEVPLIESNTEIDLWTLAPPEIAAAHEVITSADVEVPLMESNTEIDLWTLAPPEVAEMFQDALDAPEEPALTVFDVAPPRVSVMVQDTPETILNPDWMADTAIVLPAYWLDGNEPPHLLMVSDATNPIVLADNAVYMELLGDGGVEVQLTDLPGCGVKSCTASELDALDLFLDEVMFSS